MKAWHKAKQEDFGRILLIWRHRAVSRFFMKIATWLLGGYVTGILTSIIIDTLGDPVLSQKAGRIAFLVVFVLGVVNAFFQNVLNGMEFRISEKALVSVKSLFGSAAGGNLLKSVGKLLGQHAEYILWNEIKDIKDEQQVIMLILKEDEATATVDISSLLRVEVLGVDGKKDIRHSRNGKLAVFSKDEKFDQEAMRLILQKARDAKRQAALEISGSQA